MRINMERNWRDMAKNCLFFVQLLIIVLQWCYCCTLQCQLTSVGVLIVLYIMYKMYIGVLKLGIKGLGVSSLSLHTLSLTISRNDVGSIWFIFVRVLSAESGMSWTCASAGESGMIWSTLSRISMSSCERRWKGHESNKWHAITFVFTFEFTTCSLDLQ